MLESFSTPLLFFVFTQVQDYDFNCSSSLSIPNHNLNRIKFLECMSIYIFEEIYNIIMFFSAKDLKMRLERKIPWRYL